MPSVVTPVLLGNKCLCGHFCYMCATCSCAFALCVLRRITIPRSSHVKTAVTCQTWAVWWCHLRQPKAARADGAASLVPVISLTLCGGYCFLAFQLFEHLAEMVSGGCALSPGLAPCRPSHWQEIRLHQYVWEVQRDLRDGSYFSWYSTLRGGCQRQKKKTYFVHLCLCVCVCGHVCVCVVACDVSGF